ncbi:MAG: hypothetical protein K0R59_2694 [Sphingobacterium sp.]|jgi:hypothetical protein|nr:hypothetical protein [Sphingobacterium sp.]
MLLCKSYFKIRITTQRSYSNSDRITITSLGSNISLGKIAEPWGVRKDSTMVKASLKVIFYNFSHSSYLTISQPYFYSS